MRWVVLSLGLVAAPALADGLTFFQTPSGNIFCMIATGEAAEVRCDMLALMRSFRERPAECDLDWGDSFAVGAEASQGTMVCHGDTVQTPDAPVLDYGHSLELGGFRCTSETSGLTCVNAGGHGFTLSRAEQRLF
jgi:hypothetical protein